MVGRRYIVFVLFALLASGGHRLDALDSSTGSFLKAGGAVTLAAIAAYGAKHFFNKADKASRSVLTTEEGICVSEDFLRAYSGDLGTAAKDLGLSVEDLEKVVLGSDARSISSDVFYSKAFAYLCAGAAAVLSIYGSAEVYKGFTSEVDPEERPGEVVDPEEGPGEVEDPEEVASEVEDSESDTDDDDRGEDLEPVEIPAAPRGLWDRGFGWLLEDDE